MFGLGIIHLRSNLPDTVLDTHIMDLTKKLMDNDHGMHKAMHSSDHSKVIALVHEQNRLMERIHHILKVKKVRLMDVYKKQDTVLKDRQKEIDKRYTTYKKKLHAKLKEMGREREMAGHLKSLEEHHKKTTQDYEAYKAGLGKARQEIERLRKEFKKSLKDIDDSIIMYRHA